MVRTYKRKSMKGLYDEADLRKAIDLVAKKRSIRSAADECNVNRETLRRKIKCINLPGVEFELQSNYSHEKVFTAHQEHAIVDYLKTCCKMFYGLTSKDCRKLAYETAVINKVKCPKSWLKNEMAGEDWLTGFLKRNKDLSLRSPEGCNLARATAFNRHNVQAFFSNYEILLKKEPRLGNPSRIYNLDETKTMTVQNSGKIIAEKGCKAVCKIKSVEKGVLVTTCCIIRADGSYLPPVLIFPRVNYRDHMLTGAPPNSLGLANPSGWMTNKLFVKTIQHFIQFSYSTKDNPSLLIYDNHESHISLEVFELAKANGVHILTLPPHSSHRMQPLDVGLYGPFQKFYNSAIDSWMLSHPGKTVSIYEVANFVGKALPRAMAPNNIINAFKKTGIFPYDPHAFSDDDFLPSLVSERPLPSSVTEETDNVAGPSQSSLQEVNAIANNSSGTPSRMSVASDSSGTPSRMLQEKEVVDEVPNQFKSPGEIRGYPKGIRQYSTRKRRQQGSSKILTASPEKKSLIEKKKKQEIKENKTENKRKRKPKK